MFFVSSKIAIERKMSGSFGQPFISKMLFDIPM